MAPVWSGWTGACCPEVKVASPTDAEGCCTGPAGEERGNGGYCNTLMGNAICYEACVDPETARNHRGSCGNRCGPCQVCEGGQCRSICQPGYECCNGSCCPTGSCCGGKVCCTSPDTQCCTGETMPVREAVCCYPTNVYCKVSSTGAAICSSKP